LWIILLAFYLIIFVLFFSFVEGCLDSSGIFNSGFVLLSVSLFLSFNNTGEITFAAAYGEIKISIVDEYDNPIYDEVMIAPRLTHPHT
jgi:hypothetical protein